MSLQSHDHCKSRKHVRRPKKSPAEHAKRQRVQKKRLVALGVAQEVADKLAPNEIRTMLRHPKQVVKSLEK